LPVSNQCHTLQTIHTRHTTTSATKGINSHTNTILWEEMYGHTVTYTTTRG
jgi:hypothetical protein